MRQMENNNNLNNSRIFGRWPQTKIHAGFFVEFQKFCSNECYMSSRFYRDQLLTSPLWLRNKEARVPIKFHDELNSQPE